MPGTDYILGGPIYWFMVTLLFLAGMMAAFVILDSLRRAFFAHTAQRTWRWWTYVVVQAAYLALLLVVQTSLLPPIASAVMVLLTPFVLVQSVAYLLRVVFPKSGAPVEVTEAAEAAEAATPTVDAATPIANVESSDEPTE